MVTQVSFDTLSQVSQGNLGTAPKIWSATTDQALNVITTAGALEDLINAGIVFPFDIFFINYDVDGTEASGIFLATDASGGSLEAYPDAVGGALLAVNNLDDVADAATAAENLGLGVTDSPSFANVTVTSYFKHSAANALTAHAGGGQGSALQLAKGINRVTTVATAGDSVKLPAAVAGLDVVVINADSADAMDVFPATGESINALSANTAISVAANKTILFFCAVDGIWNSILTA